MSVNNSSFQRNCNISLIANKIRKNKECSRVEIAKDLHLYKSSVTNIVSTLLDNNIIVETTKTKSKNIQGRKATLLKLNPKIGNIVGIEINPLYYKFAFVDFGGKTIYKDSGEMPKVSFEKMINYVMEKVINISNLLSQTILAINFGLAGIIDTRKGIINYVNELDVHNFNIYEYGIKHYGIPFYCDNDADCCSWYELIKRQNDHLGDFLSVYTVRLTENFEDIANTFTGIGIGMSIVINNSVYVGRNFKSGEYLSCSWNGDFFRQSGLEKSILQSALKDEKSFRIWLKDLCTSLIPIISILDINNIFLLGESFSDSEQINSYIREDSPNLLKVLENEKINLNYEKDSSYIVAEGSALMFLQKLFNIPNLAEVKDKTYFDWDKLFEIIRKGSSNGKK